MRLRTPGGLAAVIAVAGIVGGTAVYLTGSRISDDDRVAVLAWDRVAAEELAGPRARLDRLGSMSARLPDGRVAVAGWTAEALGELVEARAVLEAVAKRSILRPVAGNANAFLDAAREAFDTLASVAMTPRAPTADELAGITDARGEALERYHELRDSFVRLRCRARIDACDRTSLPA